MDHRACHACSEVRGWSNVLHLLLLAWVTPHLCCRGGLYGLVIIRSLRSLRLLRLFRVVTPLADIGEVLVASMGSFTAIGILILLFWWVLRVIISSSTTSIVIYPIYSLLTAWVCSEGSQPFM